MMLKLTSRSAVACSAAVVLLAAMALDTRVVKIGSASDVRSDVFLPETFGRTEFPKVQAVIEGRAVDAATLAAAIAKDQAAAETQYGVPSDAGAEIAVKFTGKVGAGDSGVYAVAVPGVPDSVQITVQTGPAITGTDLRDGTNRISFGQFSNQIDYQNAGSALNNDMKKQVLAKVDTANLTGKTISVVGVFQLTDPANWVVTPARLTVQ